MIMAALHMTPCLRSWRGSSVPGFMVGVLAGLLASHAGVGPAPAARCAGDIARSTSASPPPLVGIAAYLSVGAGKTPRDPEIAGAVGAIGFAQGWRPAVQRRPPPLEIASLEAAVRVIKPRRHRSRPVRICLVTSAFSGPTANGGIARAFYSLASHLAKQPAFNVTVLYAAHPYYAAGEKSSRWVKEFAAANITFVPLPAGSVGYYGARFVVRSYKIYRWLRTHQDQFDVISYHDYMANGYFTALAKHQGLAFSNVQLLAQCHSTTRWADELNFRPPKDHNSLAYYYMEQKSVEYADARVSPSMYFFEWMQDTGYDFPAQSNFVLQNTLHPLLPDVQTVTHRKVNHIVFFGRLEIRKGLLVFINALNLLGDQVPAAVTFLGPSTSVDGVPAREVIRKHYTEHNWNFTLHIAETYDTEQALAYMQDQKAIAVMPTLGDNSPYALMEVIASNIPVITSLAGGCHELIDTPADGPSIVPVGDERALASAMERVLTEGIANARMSTLFSTAVANYIDFFKVLGAAAAAAAAAAAVGDKKTTAPSNVRSDMVVGITSYNRPDTLLQTVRSIVAQRFNRNKLHVIILDDSSTHPKIPAALASAGKWLEEAGIAHSIVISDAHSFVSETRNRIFREALKLGDNYVCLMDDDDLAEEDMLVTYSDVLHHTEADVVADISTNYDVAANGTTSFSHVSLGVGNALAHNFFINNFGKANFCVKPSKALAFGGHHEGPRAASPYVDWGFLTRASLAGLRIELVPEPLYKYTKNSPGSVWSTRVSPSDRYNGHRKMIDDFSAHVPKEFADALQLCRFNLAKPALTGDGPL